MSTKIKKDDNYMNIVGNILDNEEFNQIKRIEHHGTTRFEHSVRVSYYSYKVSKLLHLDYVETARAGLLHDFFISDEDRNAKDRFVSTFVHPKEAVDNSMRVFGINEKEKDIIKSHMFPINISLPKYAESWIVSMVDKVVGSYEFGRKFGYLVNVYLILLLNIKL